MAKREAKLNATQGRGKRRGVDELEDAEMLSLNEKYDSDDEELVEEEEESENEESEDNLEKRAENNSGKEEEPSSSDDDDDDDDENDDSEEEEDEDEVEEGDAKSGLDTISFETLQKLRSDGSIAPQLLHQTRPPRQKRANKNRPMELPVKKPVARFREVLQAPKQVARDPRFESLSGEYDESRFKAAYRFLFDEEMPAEKERLRKAIKKEKNPARKEELQGLLKGIERQIQGEQERRRKSEKEAEWKRKESEAVKEGKRPFFISKAAKKKRELLEKFKDLKESGKLDSFLAKKRRRISSKEHTKVPFRRVVD